MEEYIHGALAARLICPLSSPAGAGFLVVNKKDGSLHPSIDYRRLNEVTMKKLSASVNLISF